MSAQDKVKDENSGSMEDILQSIKDIIANEPEEDKKEDGEAMADEEKKEAPKDEAPAKEEAEKAEATEGDAADEILELTDVVEDTPAEDDGSGDVLSDIDAALAADEAPAEEKEKAPAEDAPVEEAPAEEVLAVEDPFEEAAPEPEPAKEEKAEETAPEAPKSTEERLVSEEAAQASTSSLKNLVDNLPKTKVESPGFRSGNTVEDIVAESLRPMLSEWLDKNLPTIVERIVEKEVKKLIPNE
jgi:hypothetical protein